MALSNSDHGSSLFDHASVHRATGSLIEGPPTGGAWDFDGEGPHFTGDSVGGQGEPASGRHGNDAGTQRGNSPWFRRG